MILRHRLPAVFVIEPTNRCNMRCLMCPQNRQERFGDMKMGLFREVVQQVKGQALFIQLYHVGEPTMHKHIIEMIQFVKTVTSARVEISTNLRWRNPDRFALELASSGVDRVLCCVEGAGSVSHKELRINGDYDMAVANVMRLSRAKMEKMVPVDIVVKMIETSFNQRERSEFEKLWNGVEGVRPLTTWLNTWAGSMPEVQDFATRLCPNSKRPRGACAELWNKMVVRWNGDVVLCCHDWRGQVVLGNVENERLEDIWNGPSLSGRRSSHLRGKFDDICSGCLEWSTAEEFTEDYGIEVEYLVNPKNDIL